VLYNRIVLGGTLSDTEGVPDPLFALPSTINWIRALALLVSSPKLDFDTACQFYAGNRSRSFTGCEEKALSRKPGRSHRRIG
jgi:hypothetical protein